MNQLTGRIAVLAAVADVLGPDLRPRCPRRQCRGRIPHSRIVHHFGWLLP